MSWVVSTTEGVKILKPLAVQNACIKAVTKSPLQLHMGTEVDAQGKLISRIVFVTNAQVAKREHCKTAHVVEEMDVAIPYILGEPETLTTMLVPTDEAIHAVKPVAVGKVDIVFACGEVIQGLSTFIVHDKNTYNVFLGITRHVLTLPPCPELLGKLVLYDGQPYGLYTHNAQYSYAIPLATVQRLVAARMHKYTQATMHEYTLPYVLVWDKRAIRFNISDAATIIDVVQNWDELCTTKLLPVPDEVDQKPREWGYGTPVVRVMYPYAIFFGDRVWVVPVAADGILSHPTMSLPWIVEAINGHSVPPELHEQMQLFDTHRSNLILSIQDAGDLSPLPITAPHQLTGVLYHLGSHRRVSFSQQ